MRILNIILFSLSVLFLIWSPLREKVADLSFKTFYYLPTKLKTLVDELINIKKERDLWLKRAKELESLLLDSYYRDKEGEGLVAKALEYQRDYKYPERILINLGRKDGVKYGYTLLSPQGFVGYVSEVYENFSWAKTVFNPRTELVVLLRNFQYLGIFRGGIPPYCEFLDLEIIPEAGDTVLTSGLGKLIPAGIPIGIVEKNYKEENLTRVQLKPLWNPLSTTNFILVPPQETDLEEFLSP